MYILVQAVFQASTPLQSTYKNEVYEEIRVLTSRIINLHESW